MSKLALCSPLLLLLACGGSHPAAENPKPAESEPRAATEKAAADGTADTDQAAGGSSADTHEAKKAAAQSSAEGPQPTRSAKDILTAPDVVFMLSFNDSDVKQSADSKCSATSGNDPKQMNACMANARKAIDIDGYRFKQKDGKWWWLALHTQGKVLHTLHKFEIEFGPEQEGRVTLKPKGKDQGSAAGRTPSSVIIQVPNEYQIVLNDSKLGKLVYEAKIGIASD